jgi:hypothetical protein
MATITNPLAAVSTTKLAEAVETADHSRSCGDLESDLRRSQRALSHAALRGEAPEPYDLTHAAAIQAVATEARVEYWDRVFKGDKPFLGFAR